MQSKHASLTLSGIVFYFLTLNVSMLFKTSSKLRTINLLILCTVVLNPLSFLFFVSLNKTKENIAFTQCVIKITYNKKYVIGLHFILVVDVNISK